MNDIQEDLFNAGIASNVSTTLTQITKVCKVFTKLKNINNKFKMSYEERIDKSLEAISLLTHASREKDQYLVHFDIHSILDFITSKNN